MHETLRTMRTLFHRLFGFTRTRGFDAAGGGRRWEGARTVDGLNTAILAGATTAARRAGWYARNNPWVAAAVDSLVGTIALRQSGQAGRLRCRHRLDLHRFRSGQVLMLGGLLFESHG